MLNIGEKSNILSFNTYSIVKKIPSNKNFNKENNEYLLYFNILNLLIFIQQNSY